MDKHENNTKFLESLKQNPRELLSNWEKLSQFMVFASSDDDTLIAALLAFYEVHRKEVEFIYWLVNREIPSVVSNPNTFSDSLLFHLFSVQFFGDRGKRYLSELVEPLVKRVAQKDDSTSFDNNSTVSNSEDSASVVSAGSFDIPHAFVIEECTKFVERLMETRDLCPLVLRETFSSFCKVAIEHNITNPFELATKYFLIKCICPVLVAPDKVMVLEDQLGDNATCILQEISKVMLFVATGHVEEGAFPLDIKSLVAKLHTDAVTFMETLAVCATGRKMFLSSVAPPTQDEILTKEQELRERIADYIVTEAGHQAEELYQEKYKQWMDLIASPKWKIALAEKNPKLPAEYHVASLKTEGSPLLTLRYCGKFRVDFKTLAEFIEAQQPEVRNDPRIEGYEKVQIFNSSHYDFTMKSVAVFPVAAREYLCTRHCKMESETRFTALFYSILRPDRPITKKIIRGQINLTGLLLTRDEDPQWTNFDYIFHVDLKGSIPAWLVNNATSENMKSLKALARLFSSLNPANNVSSLATPKAEKKKKKEKKEK